MDATLTNEVITSNTQATQTTIQSKTYKKSDSKEFISGIFYIFKKVFLLG